MKKRKTFWRLLAKSLGEKAGKNDKEADRIALIRLLITSQILITNFFIIGGVIVNVASIKRHWNDETKIEVFVETSAPDYQTPPVKYSNKTLEFE